MPRGVLRVVDARTTFRAKQLRVLGGFCWGGAEGILFVDPLSQTACANLLVLPLTIAAVWQIILLRLLCTSMDVL